MEVNGRERTGKSPDLWKLNVPFKVFDELKGTSPGKYISIYCIVE